MNRGFVFLFIFPFVFSADCNTGCNSTMIGDGTCNTECDVYACNWDNGDCGSICSTSCLYTMVGDGVCQSYCNTEKCSYDLNDCTSCKNAGCTLSNLGNGVCNSNCDIAICNYDNGECNKYVIYNQTYELVNYTQSETDVKEWNYGKVAGVGLGVFLTIVAIIVGVLVCIIGTATPCFLVMFILGILIPLITFLIVGLAPHHKNEEKNTDNRHDYYLAARIVFLVIMVVFGLFSCVSVVNFYFGVNLKTRRVDSRITGAALADLLEKKNEPPQEGNDLQEGQMPQGDGLEMQPVRDQSQLQYRSRGDAGQAYDPYGYMQDQPPSREQSRFIQGLSRFSQDQGRFGPDQSRFGPDQSRFGPDQSRFGPDQSRLGQDQSRFGQDQSRLGQDQSRFGQDQGRFNQDQGRFGQDQSRFSQEQGRFGQDQSRFSPDQSRFGQDPGRLPQSQISANQDPRRSPPGYQNEIREDLPVYPPGRSANRGYSNGQGQPRDGSLYQDRR
ncbi:unnamed protein product [Blepharisma stoltei]|uniref:LNR domain-containing protein n=1 Tax=Blepharisma stoltei TaxID=1481888 RepID=A0AAU9IX43_9CILI|nr:unnamed protein product [Blepharisma stoltei]